MFRYIIVLTTFYLLYPSCSLEHPCPPNYNPADHYIYTLAIVPQKEDESRERVKRFTDEYERRKADDTAVDVATTKGKEVDVTIKSARFVANLRSRLVDFVIPSG